MRELAAGIIIGTLITLSAIKRRWISVPDPKKDHKILELSMENARLDAENAALQSVIDDLRDEGEE